MAKPKYSSHQPRLTIYQYWLSENYRRGHILNPETAPRALGEGYEPFVEGLCFRTHPALWLKSEMVRKDALIPMNKNVAHPDNGLYGRR